MGSVTAARVAAPTLLDVIPSFERHLRAENKAARTIQSYTEAVRRLHDFCSANGMPLEVATSRRSTSRRSWPTSFRAGSGRRAPAPGSPRSDSSSPGSPAVTSGRSNVHRWRTLKPPKVPAVPVPRAVDGAPAGVASNGRTRRRVLRPRATPRSSDASSTPGARLSELSELRLGDVDLDLGP